MSRALVAAVKSTRKAACNTEHSITCQSRGQPGQRRFWQFIVNLNLSNFLKSVEALAASDLIVRIKDMEPEDIKKTAETVEGIVKAIPIYEDLLQPATQELGKGLEIVAKTVNIALAPLSGLVWGYDQIKQYLLNKITLRLSHTRG